LFGIKTKTLDDWQDYRIQFC